MGHMISRQEYLIVMKGDEFLKEVADGAKVKPAKEIIGKC